MGREQSGAEQSEELCYLTPALLKHWSYGRERSGAERRNLLPHTSPSKALVLWGGSRAERSEEICCLVLALLLKHWSYGEGAEQSGAKKSLIPALYQPSYRE